MYRIGELSRDLETAQGAALGSRHFAVRVEVVGDRVSQAWAVSKPKGGRSLFEANKKVVLKYEPKINQR
jgi:hypothetical protein